MPGGIRTNLQRHQSGPEWDEIDRSYDWKTVEEGAATTVFVATSPLLNGIGGRYFEDCREAEVVDPAVGHGRQQGVAAFALDAQAPAEPRGSPSTPTVCRLTPGTSLPHCGTSHIVRGLLRARQRRSHDATRS